MIRSKAIWGSALLPCALLACRGEPQPRERPPSPAGSTSAPALVVDPALLGSGRVALGQVQLQKPTEELRAVGYVQPDVTASADVGALVMARVRTVNVREGDRVSAGQLLAELEAPDAARVAGELSRVAAERARAERALDREKRLIASRATSQRELELAEAELGSLSAQERSAQTLLSAYGAVGSRVSVRAPMSGVLTRVSVGIGTRVDAGDNLFRIVDPERFIVRAEVLERDARRVSLGAEATLSLPDGTRCEARVTSRGAEVERSRHTVSVRLEPRSCSLPIAGQVLDVRILSADTAGALALAVPRDALVELDGATAVFVADAAVPGRFQLSSVIVSRLTETTAFLEKGPSPGTRVAVTGTILLKGEWMSASLE